jgi:hypothetical protein
VPAEVGALAANRFRPSLVTALVDALKANEADIAQFARP